MRSVGVVALMCASGFSVGSSFYVFLTGEFLEAIGFLALAIVLYLAAEVVNNR